MLFVVFRLDAESGAKQIRQAARPAHLEYVRSLGPRVKAGGPLLADDGETAIGGLMVIEATDRAQAEAIVRKDPYELAGLSRSVEIRAWRWQTNRPAGLT